MWKKTEFVIAVAATLALCGCASRGQSGSGSDVRRPEMWKSYGITGGWLAATILIGICWYMNHWLGMIWNEPGRLWVDQGWAVCSSGVAWAVVRFRAELLQCLPTLLCCIAGGSPAGVLAAKLKPTLPGFRTEISTENIPHV